MGAVVIRASESPGELFKVTMLGSTPEGWTQEAAERQKRLRGTGGGGGEAGMWNEESSRVRARGEKGCLGVGV